MKLWYRRKVEFEFPLTALLTWPGNRHRCQNDSGASRVYPKGLQRDYSGEKFGLTDRHTCFESRNTMQIDYKP